MIQLISDYETRAMVVLDFKTDKVLSSYQFGEVAQKYKCIDLHYEVPSWNGWRLALVSYGLPLTERASGISFTVAAIKKNRVVLTGFTIEDEDVKDCHKPVVIQSVVEKGFMARFDNSVTYASVYKKISFNKRAVKSANTKKLAL